VLWQVDVSVQRLPDQLTVSAFAVATAVLSTAAVAGGEPGRVIGVSAGAGGLTAGYLLLFLCCPAGIGLGDVKLALPLGAVLGWHGWFPTLLGATAGFVLCGLVSAMLLAAGKVGRKDVLPHGPFMLLGTLATVLVLG
jgi:leader peptidase (prepilin peptidase)/N-methyltransferase